MHKVAIILAPTLGKLILSSMFGPGAGTIGGTLFSMAANRFQDAKEAREAANMIESIGSNIAEDIVEALFGDGAKNDEIEVVALEMEQLLRNVSLSSILVDASLNEAEIAQTLRGMKKPVGLSDRETGYLNLALTLGSARLRILAPTLAGYSLERDEFILATLRVLSRKYKNIKENGDEIRKICDTLLSEVEGITSQSDRDKIRFENTYFRQIEKLLNYVEILGLEELPTNKQDAELSVAYLSLSLHTGAEDASSIDFSHIMANLKRSPVRLVMEGGAGSGKSTLLRWAAINLNNPYNMFNIFSEKRSYLFSNFKSELLKSEFLKINYLFQDKINENMVSNIFDEKKLLLWENISKRTSILFSNHKGTFNKAGKLVPILIRLRELDNGLPPVSKIYQQISPAMPDCPVGWIESHLESGTALIMFDGVDEVPIGVNRDKMISQIAEFSKMYPKCSVIVTSRPGAFSFKPSRLSNFKRAYVEDLDSNQQEQFIVNWHSAWSKKFDIPKIPAIEKRDSLIKKLDNEKTLRKLATNPLICASICALHEHDEENLPNDERGLCEGLTRMLVERRDRSQGLSTAPINLENFGSAYQIPFEKKKVVLAKIAAEMLRSGSSSFSTGDLLKVLPDTVISIGKQAEDVPKICAALVERSGVLRGSSPGHTNAEHSDNEPMRLPEGVEFIHNRFKEWLGSTHFISSGTSDELVQRAHEDGIAEACVFAAAAPDQSAFSQKLITGLLNRSNKEKSRIVKRKLRVLALRCANAAPSLAVELLQKTERLGSTLLPPKTLEEAHALSELGDFAIPKLQPDHKTLKARELIPIIRCLALIDTPKARKALGKYRKDKRWTVVNELSQALPPAEIPLFVESLQDFSKVTVTSLKIRKRCSSLPNEFFDKLIGTDLDLGGTGVSSISGISRSKNLRSVLLNHTPITNFDELREVQGLERVDLSGCDLDSLQSLDFGKNLKSLSLDSTNLDSLKGIEGNAGLNALTFGCSAVKDASHLAKVKSISVLRADGCDALTSWEFLASQTNLVELGLNGSNFDQYQYLADMASVTLLDLGQLRAVDCGQVAKLPLLTQLLLESSELLNMEAISGLLELQILEFGGTNLGNIDFLANLRKIEYLSLRLTPVKDIAVVENMPNLEALNLSNTRVKSLEPLRCLKRLNYLLIGGLDIDDFSPLEHLPNLKVFR